MADTENPLAFPSVGEGFGEPLYSAPGMTLRDWFAGQALTGIIAHQSGFTVCVDNEDWSCPAGDAYSLADEMLIARKQSA